MHKDWWAGTVPVGCSPSEPDYGYPTRQLSWMDNIHIAVCPFGKFDSRVALRIAWRTTKRPPQWNAIFTTNITVSTRHPKYDLVKFNWGRSLAFRATTNCRDVGKELETENSRNAGRNASDVPVQQGTWLPGSGKSSSHLTFNRLPHTCDREEWDGRRWTALRQTAE